MCIACRHVGMLGGPYELVVKEALGVVEVVGEVL